MSLRSNLMFLFALVGLLLVSAMITVWMWDELQDPVEHFVEQVAPDEIRQLQERNQRIEWVALGLVAASGIVGLITFIRVRRRVVDPLSQFMEEARRIRGPEEIPSSGDTDIRDLRPMLRQVTTVLTTDKIERQRILSELRKSERQYRALYEGTSCGIVVIDLDDGKVIDCNRATLSQNGAQSREQLIGVHASGFSPENQPDGTPSYDLAQKHIQTAVEQGANQFEWLGQRLDGELWYMESIFTPVDLGDRRVLQAVTIDITERKQAEEEIHRLNQELEARVRRRTSELEEINKRLEREVTERVRTETEKADLQERLHQSQKMEALGQIASGVAHDFNNMLTVISAHTGLVRREAPESDTISESLTTMEEAVSQATDVSRSLLAFSQKLKTEKETINLRTAVEQTGRMLYRILPAAIELEIRLGNGNVWVHADQTQLQQVVLNLALNARDAMPDGGKISILLSSDSTEGPGSAILRIVDTGIGMSREVQSHIFEPFFSTKPSGRGTGLGLFVANAIIGSHDGKISVVSQPGAGSTFTVSLPLQPAPEKITMSPGLVAELSGKGEVILLAEDNEQVRSIIAAELLTLSYQVIQVADGDALLEQFREFGDRIRLLLFDIDLPKRSGLECLRELRTEGVKTPAIVMTGTAGISLDELRDGDSILLLKPFRMAKVAELVNSRLNPSEG